LGGKKGGGGHIFSNKTGARRTWNCLDCGILFLGVDFTMIVGFEVRNVPQRTTLAHRSWPQPRGAEANLANGRPPGFQSRRRSGHKPARDGLSAMVASQIETSKLNFHTGGKTPGPLLPGETWSRTLTSIGVLRAGRFMGQDLGGNQKYPNPQLAGGPFQSRYFGGPWACSKNWAFKNLLFKMTCLEVNGWFGGAGLLEPQLAGKRSRGGMCNLGPNAAKKNLLVKGVFIISCVTRAGGPPNISGGGRWIAVFRARAIRKTLGKGYGWSKTRNGDRGGGGPDTEGGGN